MTAVDMVVAAPAASALFRKFRLPVVVARSKDIGSLIALIALDFPEAGIIALRPKTIYNLTTDNPNFVNGLSSFAMFIFADAIRLRG